MDLILQKILNNIEAVSAIVVALAALVVLLVSKYKEIRRLLAEKELIEVAAPLITQAENSVNALAAELATTPKLPSFVNDPSQNAFKNSVVAQALVERNPKLLKKAKLTDALSIANFVSQAYSVVKPVIKGLIKK